MRVETAYTFLGGASVSVLSDGELVIDLGLTEHPHRLFVSINMQNADLYTDIVGFHFYSIG